MTLIEDNVWRRWFLKISTSLPGWMVWPQALFLLIVRLFWGWGFMQTGMGKFRNLEAVTQWFAEIGVPFASVQAPMVATVELVCGFLVLIGLLSRVAAIPLAGTMIVAYATAHREELSELLSNPDVFLSAEPFLFLFAMIIVILFGPGRLSVDGLVAGILKVVNTKQSA